MSEGFAFFTSSRTNAAASEQRPVSAMPRRNGNSPMEAPSAAISLTSPQPNPSLVTPRQRSPKPVAARAPAKEKKMDVYTAAPAMGEPASRYTVMIIMRVFAAARQSPPVPRAMHHF